MTSVDRILGESNVDDAAQAAYLACRYASGFEVDPGVCSTEAEKKIAKSAYWAYLYAINISGRRFLLGEPVIAKDPNIAYVYARDVIKGLWPEAEATIAKDPETAFRYAKYIIKDRFPMAEEKIAKSEWSAFYLMLYPETTDDWIMNGWIDWLDA